MGRGSEKNGTRIGRMLRNADSRGLIFAASQKPIIRQVKNILNLIYI